MKRSRGRNRRPGGNNNQNNFNNPNRHFESVGPDVKIRGSAQQVLDKYQQYARDAQTSGDRVLSEAYFQFAEHYLRIVAKQNESRDRSQQPNRGNRDDRDMRRDDRDNNRNESDDDGIDTQGEAEETEARVERRDAPVQQDRDDDSLRVIDADESDNDADSGNEQPRREEAPRRERSRRKPYNGNRREEEAPAAEAEAAPADPADGVMKTLSRGRRKVASEGAETPAETTD